MSAGTYELVPTRVDEWDEMIYYRLSDDFDPSVIQVGTTGNITVVLDSRENVLKLPVRAIHEAGEDRFVYVIGENGIREAKPVKVGLTGNDGVEIVEGLKEGDVVILK